jgi:DNA-binding NarL/FixJ family response regulator
LWKSTHGERAGMAENRSMSIRRLTVVLAEPHPRMRASMRTLMDSGAGIRVLAAAGDLALTRQHLAGHRPDVLVLDLRMPDGSSFDAIGAACSSVAIVALSFERAAGFAARALDAGARGYVLTDRADRDLAAAVRAAAAGERFVSEPVASRLAASAL